MIEIDEQDFITVIWDALAPGCNEPDEGFDPWPEAQGFTEQLYAQMLGLDDYETVTSHHRR